MRALVIQHDHLCVPAVVGERLHERGYDLQVHLVVSVERYDTPDVVTTFPDPTDFDLVVTLGAPWSVYDHGTVGSWVLSELDLLRRADAAAVPVLGICFGGQLLALAHGGSVSRSESPELGWVDVSSDDDDLVPSGSWFAWHYDRWEAPAGSVEVARNTSSPQAFVLRRNLALQFHPEITAAVVEGWIGDAGGRRDLAQLGLDAATLVRQTREVAAENRRRAAVLVDGFLAHVAAGRAQPIGSPARPV